MKIKKTLKKILPGTVMLCTIPCAHFTSSCGGFIVDPQISAHDKDSWQHAIEHISSCKHPTIYFSVRAAYYYQQAANLYFSSCQRANQFGYTYNNDEYKFQDSIFLVNFSAWHYKENMPPQPSQESFNLEFDKLVNKQLGYYDIIAESKNAGSFVDITKGNNMLISNLQDFNLKTNYNENDPDFVPLVDSIGDYSSYVKVLNVLLDLYDKNIKFNIVTNDYWWDSFVSRSSKGNKESLDCLTNLIQRVDKIYMLSDGSYTWYTEHNDYFSYRIQNGYYSSSQQEDLWNSIKSSNIEMARKYCYLVDQFLFYNNEKYYYHFSPSSTATFASCLLDEQSYLTKESTYKFSTPWLVPDSYSVIFGGRNEHFEKYVKSYLGLFKYDYDTKPRFDTLLDPNTINNFDYQKKNLLFLLPGALRKGQCDERVFDECNKILNKIMSNFPMNEWNYIYKAHPRMTLEDVQQTIKKLFKVTEVPTNTVIIDPVYPFEYVTTLDQWMVKNGIEEHYHFIDPNTLNLEKPNGVITSFDMFTTSVYSTMSMFGNEYGIDWEDVKHIVNNGSFYIPTKFSILTYEYNPNFNFSKMNIEALWKFYLPLYQNNEFPSIDNFSIFDDNSIA